MEFVNFNIANAHKHKSGIYQIKSSKNGKFYIGSAKSFYYRWHVHCHHLREDTHFNDHLIAHKNKYGMYDLTFEVLEFCDESKLIEREQWWLDITNCCDRTIGFNKCPTAQSQLGREMSQEHRNKVGKRSVGNKYSVGRKLSEETKMLISKSQGVRLAQYSMDGKLIKVFETPLEASKEGFNRGVILHVLHGRAKHSDGYFWRYLYGEEEARDLLFEEIGKPSFRKRRKTVVLLNEGGEELNEWPNTKTASVETNTPNHRVLKMCNGKLDSFYGKKFRYKISFDAPKNNSNSH